MERGWQPPARFTRSLNRKKLLSLAGPGFDVLDKGILSAACEGVGPEDKAMPQTKHHRYPICGEEGGPQLTIGEGSRRDGCFLGARRPAHPVALRMRGFAPGVISTRRSPPRSSFSSVDFFPEPVQPPLYDATGKC